MSVRVSAAVKDPGGVEVSLTISMTLNEWIRLDEQLQSGWPSSELSMKIGSVVRKVRKEFYPEENGNG